MKSLDQDALRMACYEVARSTRWGDNPVDEALASAMVDLYFEEAMHHEEFIRGQNRDPNLLVRAVRYLALKHALPPMAEDVVLFREVLGVLVELACPNQGIEPHTEYFLRDIEFGIAEARRDQTT